MANKSNLNVVPAAPAPASNDWKASLMVSGGQNVGNTSNMDIVFRQSPEWRGVLGYNEFTQGVEMLRAPPYSDEPDSAFPRAWTDDDDTKTGSWVSIALTINHVATDVISRSVKVAASGNSYHPIKNYLNGLQWDGKPRIDTWLNTYLGVEDSAYARSVGAKWLISAVARIMVPGCQVDTMLILEGTQGIKKTSTIRTLASNPWFTNDLGEIGSKDTAQQVSGSWIIEMAEMDALKRSDVTKVKAFLTRCVDRYRPPYGRYVVATPRSCVFIGSCNHAEFLSDDTGNRRFWPVLCAEAKIDIDALQSCRDQLWAEAVTRYAKGEQWWLADDELPAAAIEQAARMVTDPWCEPINDFLEKTAQFGLTSDIGGVESEPVVSAHDVQRRGITTAQVMQHALHLTEVHWTLSNKNRVSRCLREAGWTKRRSNGLIRYLPPVLPA